MPNYKNGSAYDDLATSPGNDIQIKWKVIFFFLLIAWWSSVK